VIAVTRLDGTPMVVNTDQIAWIEHNPDTVIALMNGEKLIVRETTELLVERVKEFRRGLGNALGRPGALSRAALCVVEGDAPGGER
jgi:flagellar protein FlbD